MAGRSPFTAAKKDAAGNGLTVPELAKTMKSAAQQADALEKECKDLKELASRLKEERDKLSNRLKEKEDDQKEKYGKNRIAKKMTRLPLPRYAGRGEPLKIAKHMTSSDDSSSSSCSDV